MEYLNLPDVLSVDSRLMYASSKSVVIKKGASNVNINRVKANSATNSSIQIDPTLSDPKGISLDPFTNLELLINVNVTTAAPTPPGTTVKDYLKNCFALRSYAISSCVNSVNLTINNQSINTQPYQYIHEVSLFQKEAELQNRLQSMSPTYPDQSYSYDSLAGSARNPLNDYASSSPFIQSRGSWNDLFQTVTSTSTVWNFNVTLYEAIFCGLLSKENDNLREALPFVTKFAFNINFLSNLSRMFSLDAVSCPLVNGISVNVVEAYLNLTSLQSSVFQRLPPVAVRSYYNVITQTTQVPVLAAGASTDVQSSSLVINSVPNKILVYVSPDVANAVDGYKYSDFHFLIEKITLQFNQVNGYLSNYRAIDLYNACIVSEGCNQTFDQVQTKTGSVLCIDPAKLGFLPDQLAPGSDANLQIMVQLTVKNIHPTQAFASTIYVTRFEEAIMAIRSDGAITINTAYLKEADVLAALNAPVMSSDFEGSNMLGAGLKDTFAKAMDFLKKYKVISRGADLIGKLAPGISPIASAIGQYADARGYGVVGGRRTNNKQMLRALRN